MSTDRVLTEAIAGGLAVAPAYGTTGGARERLVKLEPHCRQNQDFRIPFSLMDGFADSDQDTSASNIGVALPHFLTMPANAPAKITIPITVVGLDKKAYLITATGDPMDSNESLWYILSKKVD